jgi:hypothetical protein
MRGAIGNVTVLAVSRCAVSTSAERQADVFLHSLDADAVGQSCDWSSIWHNVSDAQSRHGVHERI